MPFPKIFIVEHDGLCLFSSLPLSLSLSLFESLRLPPWTLPPPGLSILGKVRIKKYTNSRRFKRRYVPAPAPTPEHLQSKRRHASRSGANQPARVPFFEVDPKQQGPQGVFFPLCALQVASLSSLSLPSLIVRLAIWFLSARGTNPYLSQSSLTTESDIFPSLHDTMRLPPYPKPLVIVAVVLANRRI